MLLSSCLASSHTNFGVESNTLLRLSSIFLLCALVIQTGFKVFIYLDYHVNKEIITQKYCENKTKPALKCHGKCHLNKLLAEDNKREDKGKNTGKELGEISPFVQHKIAILKTQKADNSDSFFLYLFTKTETEFISVFHPPSFAFNNEVV